MIIQSICPFLSLSIVSLDNILGPILSSEICVEITDTLFQLLSQRVVQLYSIVKLLSVSLLSLVSFRVKSKLFHEVNMFETVDQVDKTHIENSHNISHVIISEKFNLIKSAL